MQTKKFRKVISVLVAAGIVTAVYAPSFAEESKSIGGSEYATAFTDTGNDASKMQKVEALIASVDKAALKEKTLSNNVDFSVPSAVRNGVSIQTNFYPNRLKGIALCDDDFAVNSTVQKVGEVIDDDGAVSNVYVAIATVTGKEAWSSSSKSGVKVWAYVFWIDNFGTNNLMTGAAGEWDPGSKTIENRTITYGRSTLGFLASDALFENVSENSFCTSANISGLEFSCEVTADIVNIGTISCKVTPGILD